MQAPLTALMLCNDEQALHVIDHTFQEYGVSSYFCVNSQSAQVSASQRKFDLLMLDFDEPGADDLLEFRSIDLWGYPSVVIALASDPATMHPLLNKRVHFTLQKPFTPERMCRTLKAGYSLIVNEKRAAFRHTVCIPANAGYLEHNVRRPLENARVQDISTTGLCIQSDSIVPKDSVLLVDFELPQMNIPVRVIGKAMWSDAKGCTGLQFRFIPPIAQKRLRQWLNTLCPWDAELVPRPFGQQDLNAAAVSTRIQ